MAIERRGVQIIRTMAALHDQRRTRTTAGAFIELSALANERMLLEREVARASRRGKEIQHRMEEIEAKETRLMKVVRGEISSQERPQEISQVSRIEPCANVEMLPNSRFRVSEFSY